jgi:hypothetical protein
MRIFWNKVSVHAQCEDIPTLVSMVLWHPLPARPRQCASIPPPCVAKGVVIIVLEKSLRDETTNPILHRDENGATPQLPNSHFGQLISPCQQPIQGQTISQEFHSIPILLNPTAWLIYICMFSSQHATNPPE